MSNCKYYKQIEQVSYDNKQTWENVVPAEYRKGELYEEHSEDCPAFSRWKIVPDGYICEDGSKYEKKVLEISDDNINYDISYPVEYMKGNLIETDSIECNFKWYGHYYANTGSTIHKIIDPIKIVLCYNNDDSLSSSDIIYNDNHMVMSGYVGTCVNSIDNFIFSGMASLNAIDLSDSNIQTISESAFTNCINMRNINIPSGVTSIGDYAFYNCSGLTSITILATTPPIISGNTFEYTNNCPIYIPCNSINLYMSDSKWATFAARIYGIESGCSGPNVKFDAMFTNGRSYSNICNNDSLDSAEIYAKYPYSDLINIEIGNCVKHLNNGVFGGCEGLTSINIPDSITSIGDDAFFRCYGLTSIEIPDSVTSIGYESFRYCNNLVRVTIGSGITSIGDYAFANLGDKNRWVTIYATTPPTIANKTFYWNNGTLTIYVPAESVNTYKSAPIWSSYSSNILPIPTT